MGGLDVRRCGPEVLQQLLAPDHDVAWVVDPEWEEYLYLDTDHEAVWGGATGSNRDRRIDLVESVHPNDRESVQEAIQRLTRGQSVTFSFRTTAGEATTILCKPITQDGSIAFLAGYAVDTEPVGTGALGISDEGRSERTVIDGPPAQRYRTFRRAVENAGGAFDDAVAGGGESGNADGTDGEAAAGGEGGQASLDAETGADNGSAGDDGDDEEPTEEVVEDDDQQSGLSDFM